MTVFRQDKKRPLNLFFDNDFSYLFEVESSCDIVYERLQGAMFFRNYQVMIIIMVELGKGLMLDKIAQGMHTI